MVGQHNILKLNLFAVLASSDDVVVSVRRLFSEMKMSLGARKPNIFDLNDYQEEATTPKPHKQFGLLEWLKAFDSVFSVAFLFQNIFLT